VAAPSWPACSPEIAAREAHPPTAGLLTLLTTLCRDYAATCHTHSPAANIQDSKTTLGPVSAQDGLAYNFIERNFLDDEHVIGEHEPGRRFIMAEFKVHIKCRNANCDNAVEISDATALARLIHFVDYATVVAREVDLNGHFFPINCRRQSLCQIPIRLRFLLIKMQDASLGPIRNRFKIYDENGLDKIKIHEHLC
jgi:hypothetical protein